MLERPEQTTSRQVAAQGRRTPIRGLEPQRTTPAKPGLLMHLPFQPQQGLIADELQLAIAAFDLQRKGLQDSKVFRTLRQARLTLA